MPTTIINKLGRGVPSPSSLSVGEIAQDEATGSLYVKRLDGQVIEVSSSGGGGTGSAVAISESAPLDASSGDEWFCSKEGDEALYIFDGDVWFGIPVGGEVAAPKEYALGTTTRNGNVVLNIVDGALSVKTHSGSTKWNMEGDELIGDARTGEVNLPTQEQ